MSSIGGTYHTSYVSRHVIRFTLEFKNYFVENYKAGVHPHLIFKQCGYDPDVIGAVRIKHFTHRVQSEDLAATTLKPRKPHKAFDAAKAYEEPLDMTVLRMQNEIIYLQQEIAFIKKLSNRTDQASGENDYEQAGGKV